MTNNAEVYAGHRRIYGIEILLKNTRYTATNVPADPIDKPGATYKPPPVERAAEP